MSIELVDMENSVTQSPIRYENQEAKPGFVSSATDTKLGRAVVMGTPIFDRRGYSLWMRFRRIK